jgi:hypothetical protein
VLDIEVEVRYLNGAEGQPLVDMYGKLTRFARPGGPPKLVLLHRTHNPVCLKEPADCV